MPTPKAGFGGNTNTFIPIVQLTNLTEQLKFFFIKLVILHHVKTLLLSISLQKSKVSEFRPIFLLHFVIELTLGSQFYLFLSNLDTFYFLFCYLIVLNGTFSTMLSRVVR